MTREQKEELLSLTDLDWLAKAAKYHSVPTEEETKTPYIEGIKKARLDYYDRMLDELIEHAKKHSSN